MTLERCDVISGESKSARPVRHRRRADGRGNRGGQRLQLCLELAPWQRRGICVPGDVFWGARRRFPDVMVCADLAAAFGDELAQDVGRS